MNPVTRLTYSIGWSSALALGSLVPTRSWAVPITGVPTPPVMAATTSPASKTATAPARQFALLVGISDYGRGMEKWRTTWPNLDTSDDIAAMQQVLRDRFGFPAANITTLTNRAATRQGILNAFQKLIAGARPGDNIVFYFAGHGQQLRDTNGNEPDGLEESLVPYDYLTNKASDGAKSNLTDDRIADLLGQMRAKMTTDGKMVGSIALFLDCGWGGTKIMTPGDNTDPLPPPMRGRAWLPALDGAPPPAKSTATGGFFASDFAAQNGYIVLTAAGAGQSNRERRNDDGSLTGSLTYYLTRALNSAANATTYGDLLQSLNVGLGGALAAQTPQLEGNPDTLLLGGSARPLPTFVTPTKLDAQGLTLPVGTLQGVTTGSVYAAYPAGTGPMTDKTLIAKVAVDSTTATTSRAQLTSEYEGKVKLDALKNARFVELAHNYNDAPLKLALDGVQVPAPTLADWTMVATRDVSRDEADLILSRTTTPKPSLVLNSQNGDLVARVDDNAAAYDKIKEFLRLQSRLRTVARLHNESSSNKLKLSMRIVPVNVETDAGGKVSKVLGDRTDIKMTGGNYLVLHEGDYATFEFKNDSAKDIYVTVLDLSPDGNIAQLYPLPTFPSEVRDLTGAKAVNRVPADGQWHRADDTSPVKLEKPLYVTSIGKPYGKEMFKALIAPYQIDFKSLVQKVPVSRGAPSSSLGRMLLSSSTGKRDASPEVGDDWSTAEVTFIIAPR